MSNTPKETYEIVYMKNPAQYRNWQKPQDKRVYSSNLGNPYRDINASNFEVKNYRRIFKRKIAPEIEQKKKFKLGFIGILILVYLIMLGIFVLAIFLLNHLTPPGFHYSLQEDSSIFAPFIGIFVFVFVMLSLFFIFVFPNLLLEWSIKKVSPKISDAFYKTFSTPTLADLKKKFFKSLRIGYHPIHEVMLQVDNISDLMTKINPAYKKFVKADDFISFNYKKLPVILVEFRSVGVEASSCIFIATKINKKITTETFVQTKKLSSPSVSFAENFSVQSFNPTEARALLTVPFRTRLLKYRREHNNCSLDILFSNSVSDDENIFICIPSKKNYFEMPEQDWFNLEKSYQIVGEIREILHIIDALKLDQDIEL